MIERRQNLVAQTPIVARYAGFAGVVAGVVAAPARPCVICRTRHRSVSPGCFAAASGITPAYLPGTFGMVKEKLSITPKGRPVRFTKYQENAAKTVSIGQRRNRLWLPLPSVPSKP